MRGRPIARVVRSLRGLMLRHGPNMITCREFDDLMLGYVDGELSPCQNRLAELHLKLCPDCRDYVDDYRDTIAIAKGVASDSDVADPQAVPEALVQSILAARDN